MANAVRVAVVKGLHDLQECLTRLLLGVVAFVNDAVEEFSSGADLHDKVDIAGVFEGFIEFDDIGMV